MSSFRKKYQHAEAAPREEAVPVTTVPEGAAAKLPEPVTEPPPPEMPETKESPADVAAKTALKQRLREMEQAETLQQQQAVQHHQRMAAEPQQSQEPPTLEQQIAHLPERAKGWYRRDPKLLSDPERAAQVQYVHHVVCRELGGEGTEDAYFNRMEAMLFPSATNGQAQQHRPIESKPSVTAPAPRHEAPPRRAMSAPVSAPPSREPASMRTGRPQSFRAPLTAEETEIARASGITPERYAQEKEKMLRLRAAGQLDDQR
jgi:hypothetical protein